MYHDKTFLAIIPARGGSKGIPRKNIKDLAGKPLIAWTIEEAKKSIYLDRIILSSEDAEIIEVAKKWGCDVPFIRPVELATDETPGIDPVIHTINTLQIKYDFIVLLQPTSPLRQSFHIDQAIELLLRKKSKSLVSFCKVDKNPNWMVQINEHGELNPYIDNKTITRRQDLPELLMPNGAIYIAQCDWLLMKKSFLESKTTAFIMDSKSSLDIDTDWQWELAELFLEKNPAQKQ